MRRPLRAQSSWLLLALLALASCATPPLPPTAPEPPPPPAVEAPAPAPPGPPSASSDQDFINQAIGLNDRQIGMGRLAKGKGAQKPVRLLALHMAAEHTLLNRRLELLAKRLRLDVAPPPDQPPPALLTNFGPEFDRAYLVLVIKGHEDLIALCESEAAGGQDPRARHFARELVPVLRLHAREAAAMGGKFGA
jgi:putative membrane protein